MARNEATEQQLAQLMAKKVNAPASFLAMTPNKIIKKPAPKRAGFKI